MNVVRQRKRKKRSKRRNKDAGEDGGLMNHWIKFHAQVDVLLNSLHATLKKKREKFRV